MGVSHSGLAFGRAPRWVVLVDRDEADVTVETSGEEGSKRTMAVTADRLYQLYGKPAEEQRQQAIAVIRQIESAIDAEVEGQRARPVLAPESPDGDADAFYVEVTLSGHEPALDALLRHEDWKEELGERYGRKGIEVGFPKKATGSILLVGRRPPLKEEPPAVSAIAVGSQPPYP